MLLQIKVKLHSRTAELVRQSDGSWLARLSAPPVDGRANDELIGLVARYLKRPKSAVSIKAGVSSRLKLVKVEDA